jgi:hypothetical protein
MIHRDQNEVNTIVSLLREEELLKANEAFDLGFHLGDVVDSCVELPRDVTRLKDALSRLNAEPKACYEAFNALLGEMDDHLPAHFRQAVSLMEKAKWVILKRFPNEFPWAHEEDDEGQEEPEPQNPRG